MIYNDLQSIYNRLKWQLQGFTIIYNDLQSIYNRLKWQLQGFTIIYNGNYKDLQSITIHLQ
jgi:hypothetical protein